MHERIDFSGGLVPDFLAERMVACGSIPVCQLIGPPVTRQLTDRAGFLDHSLDELLCDLFVVAYDIRNAGAERLHGPPFFVAEGV